MDRHRAGRCRLGPHPYLVGVSEGRADGQRAFDTRRTGPPSIAIPNYRSTGLHDEPITVSGIVVIPPGPAPEGGRPIVAWAHPTTRIVPRCAPSLAIFLFQQMQGLRNMVQRGYIVAATD